MPTDQAYADQPTNQRGDGGPPSCNTGVVNGFYGWDWSQTTHEARGTDSTVPAIAADLVTTLGGATAVPGKGLQGWRESLQVFDADGYKLGQVYFGGERTDVHVVSTSTAADSARRLVVGKFGAKTSRVDTRVDTLLTYEDLEDLLRSAAGRKARLMSVASEQDGKSLGRTLYVGAPTSQVRIRVYEKWLESPGQYVEGTNRVEVQLRPPSRAKAAVSAWSAADTFCASELSRRVAGLLGTDVAHPTTLQKQRGTPDLERALQSMSNQYRPSVERWLKATGGDIGKVLDYLVAS
nr:replication initiation factor domain-containing protein [uncultured Rhodococcus sp.]